MAPTDEGEKNSKRKRKSRRRLESDSESDEEDRSIIDELNQHDVLFGRTSDTVNFQGNISFRQIVDTRKGEYMGSGRHKIKGEIARQVIDEVHSRGGRFLRRVKSDPSKQSSGQEESAPAPRNQWYVASKYKTVQKVKQALREKGPAGAEAGDEVKLAFGDSRDPDAAASNHPMPMAAFSANASGNSAPVGLGGAIAAGHSNGAPVQAATQSLPAMQDPSLGIQQAANAQIQGLQNQYPLLPSILTALQNNARNELAFQVQQQQVEQQFQLLQRQQNQYMQEQQLVRWASERAVNALLCQPGNVPPQQNMVDPNWLGFAESAASMQALAASYMNLPQPAPPAIDAAALILAISRSQIPQQPQVPQLLGQANLVNNNLLTPQNLAARQVRWVAPSSAHGGPPNPVAASVPPSPMEVPVWMLEHLLRQQAAAPTAPVPSPMIDPIRNHSLTAQSPAEPEGDTNVARMPPPDQRSLADSPENAARTLASFAAARAIDDDSKPRARERDAETSSSSSESSGSFRDRARRRRK